GKAHRPSRRTPAGLVQGAHSHDAKGPQNVQDIGLEEPTFRAGQDSSSTAAIAHSFGPRICVDSGAGKGLRETPSGGTTHRPDRPPMHHPKEVQARLGLVGSPKERARGNECRATPFRSPITAQRRLTNSPSPTTRFARWTCAKSR